MSTEPTDTDRPIETETSADPGTGVDAGSLGPGDGLLVVKDLTKKFGGLTAVDNLSFAVQEQEILGFIGPNGAGKSTTFNCITGVYPPTGGTVYYRGQDITGWSATNVTKLGLARTFQEFKPLPDRPIVENVQLSLVPDRLFSLSGLQGETRRKAELICERVGLGEQMYQLPGELPHAGLLRLELGRALATDPDLLLVDEPFAGLSNREVQEVSELFYDLRDAGLTLVVVDHNMRGLLELIDRAFVITFGSKIAEGPPEVIKDDQQVQDAYLGGEGV